ncbi:HlyD family secretion protein [Haloferula chungangensis]|uniref:HlyD family secretion protein n=1 Tax=Haloferula chungangensis TaxID=1048331 RepID=A0ABW2L1N4_9BACT
MDLLLVLCYAGICLAIFKIFKIPVTGISVLTAVLGGVFLIGFLLLGMNYNHPFSSSARLYYYTTPINPVVGGRVVDAPAKAGVEVKKGDVLFKIDPTRFQAVVDQKKAGLAEAKQSAEQLIAVRETAEAQLEEAEADAERQFEAFKRVETLALKGTGAVAQQEVDTKRGLYLTAKAAVEAAKSELNRARLAETSEINGVNTTVARLEGELAAAQYDLDQTVVRAPTDGVVEQSFLREGMMAVPLPLRPVMVFRHTEKPVFAAAFLQNSAQRLIPDSEVEVVFPAVPGRVFKGKLVRIQEAIAQGQLQPSGAIIDPESIHGEGRVLAVIELDKDLGDFTLVPGTTGVVAVYTHHMHHLGMIRKVLIRMGSWTNYIFSDGH